jgi:maltose/moltooligosaccharide transporter
LYVLSIGLIGLGGIAMLISGILQKVNATNNGFITIIIDFQLMPKIMKQLAWVQFFSWFALFSMWIYTTLAVTQHIYKTVDTTSEAYNIGANQVGEMFANYNLIAALAAFLLPVLAKYTSRKITHFIALVCGGLGLISIYFISEPTVFTMEWLPMIGVGIAWASILSIPYAILSGSLPSNKMGYYMGIFNFFIVIPQLVAASILGFLVSKFFDSEPIYALLIGGVSMVLAGIIALTIDDEIKINLNE